MRNIFRALALSSILLIGPATRGAPVALSQSAAQVLFLGDRECGDDATTCVFPAVVPTHRYLHVIIHDGAGNDDWRTQVALQCSDTMPDLAGGLPTSAQGYLEAVGDLSTVPGYSSTTPLCIVFRGKTHYWVTYYAAYLDDSPFPDASSYYPNYQQMAGRPDLPDLDVQLIHRTPAYGYDASKNAPVPGDTVTFTAQVANVGGESAPGFQYQWMLDGNLIASGSFGSGLVVGQTASFSLTWRWENRSHDLRFEVIPSADEISSVNNGLSVRTNALTLGFWVEQSAYTFFQDHQWLYCSTLPCAGSDSFADWLQRQVSSWNHMFLTSAFPEVDPAGIADRVRLDEITIVPDGSLPLHGGLASNSPDRYDHRVDLQWGIASQVVKGTYHLHWENPFDIDWGILHELGHARYLADLYRFDIPVSGSYSFSIAPLSGRTIFDSAHPLDLTNLLPAFDAGRNQLFIYQNEEHNDLMSCLCAPIYSAYSAVVLDRIRSQRASCGNANPPCNLGDWFLDMPPVNRLHIVSASGAPLPDGATIKVYYDTTTSYNGHSFDEAHSQSLSVSHGVITLASDATHAGGSIWNAGRNLLLLRIPSAGTETLCFVEPTVLNMAYWLGYRSTAHPAVYRLRLGTQTHNDCNLQLPTALVNEPFATSPDASTVRFGPLVSQKGGRWRTVTISLKDDAVPANPMRNREVHIGLPDGRSLGVGITGADGVVRVRFPGNPKVIRIEDVTDNNLIFSAVAGTRSH